MANLIKFNRYILFLTTVAILAFISEPAAAIKYLGLKEAIKYFLPKDAQLSKVSKTIPAGELAKLKKQFGLEPTTDFKETLAAGPHDIYIGRDKAGKALIYIMVLDQYWRTCYHKYAVGLEPDGKIKEIVVMEFPCRYQYPVNKKSFLKQFKGKKVAKGGHVPAYLGKDIDVVTGATATSDATAIVARKAFALFEVFFSVGK